MSAAAMWDRSWRADPRGASLADRHYNSQRVGSPQFVPPGACVVFVTTCARAVWVTSAPKREYVKHQWAGAWINSLFRNEGAGLSSLLIRSAVRASIEAFAAKGVDVPWRGLVTFVDRAKIRSVNPGHCYRVAGFRRVGETKDEKLVALQLHPRHMPGLPLYVPSADARSAQDRETVWALRRHHMLTVTVTRTSGDTADVRALVTGGNAPVDGRVMRWTVLASAASVDAPKIAAAVAVAKAWAETQADELAGAR